MISISWPFFLLILKESIPFRESTESGIWAISTVLLFTFEDCKPIQSIQKSIQNSLNATLWESIPYSLIPPAGGKRSWDSRFLIMRNRPTSRPDLSRVQQGSFSSQHFSGAAGRGLHGGRGRDEGLPRQRGCRVPVGRRGGGLRLHLLGGNSIEIILA